MHETKLCWPEGKVALYFSIDKKAGVSSFHLRTTVHHSRLCQHNSQHANSSAGKQNKKIPFLTPATLLSWILSVT